MNRPLAIASVLCLAASTDAVAENVRVDAGGAVSYAGANGRSGGSMTVEIKGMVGDIMSIGGRLEIAMLFGGTIGDDNEELDFAMAGAGLLKAEYYLIPGMVRPFVGLGAGAYTIGSQSLEGGPNRAPLDHRTGNYVGVAPQLGVDIGRLRLAVTYNAILGASLEVVQMAGTTQRVDHVSQNWLSIELAFRFGGGGRSRNASAEPPQPQSYPQPQPQPQPYPQPQPQSYPQPQPQPQPYPQPQPQPYPQP